MIYVPPSQIASDPRYTFPVGKIRVLETYLLNNQQVARLLEARDEAMLWSELASSPDYEHHLAQFSDPHEFELVLDAELKRVYVLVFGLDPDPQALSLLALRHDFHNCKVFSKAKFLGESPDLALSNLGLYPNKEWEQLFLNEDLLESELIPHDLQQLTLDVQAKLEEETDLRFRDMLWDQTLYSYLYQQIKAQKNTFIQTWLQIRIDCLNLTALMRCKQQKAHKRILERALLDNGLVPKERLLLAYDSSLEDLYSHLASSPYSAIVQEGIQSYQKEGSFSIWEKLVDDFEIEFLKQARMVPLGVEPLFAYLLAKENELKVLRIVFVGKLNKIHKNEISKRVRRLYA